MNPPGMGARIHLDAQNYATCTCRQHFTRALRAGTRATVRCRRNRPTPRLARGGREVARRTHRGSAAVARHQGTPGLDRSRGNQGPHPMKPRTEPSPRRSLRRSSPTAPLLAACSLALCSGCATSERGRAGEAMAEDPLFPALRSGNRLFQRPPPQKRIPGSQRMPTCSSMRRRTPCTSITRRTNFGHRSCSPCPLADPLKTEPIPDL